MNFSAILLRVEKITDHVKHRHTGFIIHTITIEQLKFTYNVLLLLVKLEYLMATFTPNRKSYTTVQ